MSAYSSPTPEEIKSRTGVNRKMDNRTENDLDAELEALLPDAETRTALSVTPARFEATDLTTYEVSALQIATAYRCGADYIRGIASLKVTGTQAPRMMEEAERLRAQADAYDGEDPPGRAQLYDDLFRGVVPADADSPAGPGPMMLVSTYDPASITRRPSDRIGSLDERDDVPSGSRAW